MRFADSDSSDETATSTSDITESSAGGPIDKEINDGELKEDRFRVDRRKLEQMLQGETWVSNGQTAEDFFHKIMEETSTQISWPSKLKVGAKSKKDPHIKITGDPENVFLAREKVLETLDTKRNRVTLKMDVSFTDHSHIIGKGGHSIQQVMEDTGCHIHFPDSNRNSVGEKSNQVSIAGLPEGVERARCRIRELLPMVLTFDLPLTSGFMHPVPDGSSPAIQLIQQRHGFTVTFRPKLRMTTVVVRGTRRLFPQLRQGVMTLMDYLTGNSGNYLPVNLSMEITPQHHSFVMGGSNCNINSISRETSASVTFPDPALFPGFPLSNTLNLQVPQQNNGQPRRSTVVITGHIDSVFAAWQEVMGYLPLVLMFDLKEGQELDTAQVTRLMDKLNINIIIRPKPKQNTKCLLVRGTERDSRLLFEVRRQLLGLDPTEEPLPICCDKHSDTMPTSNSIQGIGVLPTLNMTLPMAKENLPAATNGMTFSNGGNYSHSPFPAQHIPQTQMPQVTNYNELLNNNVGPANYQLLPWLLNQVSASNSSTSGIFNALLQAHMSDMALTSILTRTLQEFGSAVPPLSDQASCSSQASSLSSPNVSPCESPIFMSSNASHSSCSGSMDSLAGDIDNLSGKSWNNPYWMSESSGSEPYSESSDVSVPAHTTSALPVNHLAPVPSLQSTVFQQRLQNQGRPIVATAVNGIAKDDLPLDGTHLKNVGSIGCERRTRDYISCTPADYAAKKLQAAQAIQRPVNSGARVPTDVWSGCGFSKTMPEEVLRSRLQESRVLHRRVETIPETESTPQIDSWFSSQSALRQPYAEKRSDFSASATTGVSSSFSSSNYFDENHLLHLPKDLTKEVKDLTNLLSLLSLDKYSEVFRQQQVDLATFLTLTDRDLQELSIPFFARRKMLQAISELNLHGENSLNTQQFQPAPGAERRALFARQQSVFATSRPEW